MSTNPLRLSREATFRIVPDGVECRLGPRRLVIPVPLYEVLLDFAEPTLPADVYPAIEDELTVEEFQKMLLLYTGASVLEEVAASTLVPGAPAGPGLDSVLNPAVFEDATRVEAIAAALQRGNACVIRNAFRQDFADGVHRGLEGSTAWKAYDNHGAELFHYHHHNLYNPSEFSPELLAAQRIFGSAGTRALIAGWTGQDTSGPLNFSASLYLPGDYSLPHDDDNGQRSVSFVWHLTREWDRTWGGQLFWCPTGTYLAPSFNTLVLFNASPRTIHFVAQVAPFARGKRLTVNGWWNRKQGERVPRREPIWPIIDGQKPLKELGPDVLELEC